jgi:hypothetical protein
VIVIIVLLNVAWICTFPCDIVRFVFRELARCDFCRFRPMRSCLSSLFFFR